MAIFILELLMTGLATHRYRALRCLAHVHVVVLARPSNWRWSFSTARSSPPDARARSLFMSFIVRIAPSTARSRSPTARSRHATACSRASAARSRVSIAAKRCPLAPQSPARARCKPTQWQQTNPAFCGHTLLRGGGVLHVPSPSCRLGNGSSSQSAPCCCFIPAPNTTQHV
jgi:hypothetical protein